LLAAVRPAHTKRAQTLADQVDAEWRQKLDRIEQTATARYLVGEMLKRGQPRCIAYCWYGGPRDGVDMFHVRLESEFNEVGKNRCLTVRPDWPGVIGRKAFCEMLTLTFDDLSNLAEIGTAIRKHFRGGQRQLLYVNHTPVESNLKLNPNQYLEYLRWWDEAVLDHLDRQQHVVLGISFVVENNVKFRDAVERIAGIPAYPFSDRFVFEMLPVLQPLKAEHLRTFFKRINLQLRVDPAHQERAIQIILDSTNGEYDLVVRELEVLINEGFDVQRHGSRGAAASKE
jgi:hypothetical protein